MVTNITLDEPKHALDNSEIEYLFNARLEPDYEERHILGAVDRDIHPV